MTFLETLQSHKGGLIRLKTELYWCGGRGLDGNPGRVCLLLDAATATATATRTAAVFATASPKLTAATIRTAAAYAYLLIDGSPQWVWLSDKAIEILVNNQPTN